MKAIGRLMTAAVCALAVVALITPLSSAASPLLRTGHAQLGSCASSDVTMAVSVNRHTYRRSQPVKVAVAVKIGSEACAFSGSGERADLGPCGAISMIVRNARGHDVWPGQAAYACPLLLEVKLVPGESVLASGVWDKTVWSEHHNYGSFHPASAGKYRLVVDGSFTFPIVLR